MSASAHLAERIFSCLLRIPAWRSWWRSQRVVAVSTQQGEKRALRLGKVHRPEHLRNGPAKPPAVLAIARKALESKRL
eukprot:6193487-Pleurochrysis_carterae.AAC.3